MDRPSLYPQERRFLRRCAAHMACRYPVGWVVELGTGSGFSTQALAEGLSKFAQPREAALLTIDDYREGEAYGWSRAQAEAHIREAGLLPWVHFSSESTHSEGWRHWAGAVHVLFVDAAHDYASASADFDTWVGSSCATMCTSRPSSLQRRGA